MGDHKHKTNLAREAEKAEEEVFIPQYKTQYVQIPPQDLTCANLDKILNTRHAEGYRYAGHLVSTSFECILIFEKNT
jgi:hypothetical protein